MQTALLVIQTIISILLIAVVLMQHGNQQGISGAIAGGAETFFGKNKGRTIDAMLKKVTAVVAFLFIVSSVVLAVYTINDKKASDAAATENIQMSVDENGNVVDAEGNVVGETTETETAAEGEATETEAPAEGETAETEAPAEGETAETEAPAEGEATETEAPAEGEAAETEAAAE